MRRPSVHKVIENEEAFYAPMDVPIFYYATRCGITGGAELLRLTGENNGAGRWCGNCFSGTRKGGYQPRPVPMNRWTTPNL